MRVLIAPDIFKGSLTAAEAADALAAGWRDGWPPERPLCIECLPLADGGEGTAEVFLNALGGHWIEVRVDGPMGDAMVDARYASVPIVVACDVSNPLLGPCGATRVYGPQKGLRGEDEARQLESAPTRLADVAARTLGRDCRDLPDAGGGGRTGLRVDDVLPRGTAARF